MQNAVYHPGDHHPPTLAAICACCRCAPLTPPHPCPPALLAVFQTAREALPSALAFAKSHRTALSLFSTTCLAFVVWQTLSACRDLLLEQQPGPLAAMVAAAVGMHLTYLAANYAVVWWVPACAWLIHNYGLVFCAVCVRSFTLNQAVHRCHAGSC